MIQARHIALAGALSAAVACGSGDVKVVQVKGSDTMVNLMQGMSEEYAKVNPKIIVAVTGGGSGTGIKSIIDDTTDLAVSSREMKKKEIDGAALNNVDAVETILAYDGLAVYVHKDNPVAKLSFEDLRCIYLSDGKCDRWSDLGVTLDCGGTDEIVKLGRQNNSGTYEYFREAVLGKNGSFTSTMDQSGTQQVVDVIKTAKCAIGYGGMGYETDTARFVCLSKGKDEPCAEPSIETVKAGDYKFSRPLYVYTNGPPDGPAKEFMDWALGPEGQKVVLDTGFVPLSN